jgi:pimeloyl-ACP methyl ester carboxylesterase
VADGAEDIAAIADDLGIERLAVWGTSGGGPYALAAAALLPGRVVAVGALASPAPYGAHGLDYFAGMGQANIADTKLMLEDEAAARAGLGPERDAMLAMQPDQLAEATGSRELAEYLVRGFHAGLAPGGEGWWDDGMAQLRPWGFEVDSIRVPVQLWHGRLDTFVPFGHGEWLARTIPGVDAHLTSDDGHGSVIQRHIPELHGWLLGHF